jgi:hypothetical protein
VIASIEVQPEGPRSNPTGFRVNLQPLPAGKGQESPDLSLECWSLQACTDVVKEATGLQMLVPVAYASGMAPMASGSASTGDLGLRPNTAAR